MSRIRGKNTAPEMRVRSLLHRMGYRFRLHVRIALSASTAETLPSPHPMGRGAGGEVKRCRTPRAVSVDIVLPKHKTAIFVHGCFWHRHSGCKNCTTPTNRREWWLAKLNGNAARDQLHQAALRKLGWRALVIWECEAESSAALERFTRRVTQSGKNSTRLK
jgi:DNA mismatch endonuclease (patch repair protein)